jgi:hypothetical protein
VIAVAIPDAILLPTDEWFAQEVPDLIYIYSVMLRRSPWSWSINIFLEKCFWFLTANVMS